MKKRIAILGCENSHADHFLKFINTFPQYADYEVVGVYSDEKDACDKLHEQYGVPIMNSFDEAVGKIDGLIITARHGKYHYPYAKPYIASGIPMLIDKPITVDCDEAVEFMRELRDAGVKVCGGSSLRQAPEVQRIKRDIQNGFHGKTVGGVVRSPSVFKSPYGGFYFYSPHLVEMVLEAFGRYPNSVKTFHVENNLTVIFRYDTFDIVGLYVEGKVNYHIERFTETESDGGQITEIGGIWFINEFAEFDALLEGKEQPLSYKDFIASIFVLRAIEKAWETGEEVEIERYEV